MAKLKAWFPLHQRWFRWGLAVHIGVLLLLAHAYDMAVFQDASARLARGEGVYAAFAAWLEANGDGYYAYPPLYAYMLWASGRLAAAIGGSWWIHQILIKGWLFLVDLLVFACLHHLNHQAARTYWMLWFVPVIAIAQVQPDLWVGLTVLIAFLLSRQGRWFAVGLALAAGISLKVTPLLIVPFLLLHLARQRWRTAGWQMTGALALGLVVAWVPYLLFYNDAGQFVQVLRYHFTRPAFGLSAVTGVRLLTGAWWAANAFAGPAPLAVGALAITDQQISILYDLATPLAFAGLGVMALARRWSLEQVFVLPLLTFMLVNRVVNEQYLLQVLPLLLVIAPGAFGRLVWPYSIYVVAAGTPLRFFPQEYGIPLSPEALLPEPLRAAVGPLIGIGLAVAMGGAALLFSWRVLCAIRESLSKPRPAGAELAMLQAEVAP